MKTTMSRLLVAVLMILVFPAAGFSATECDEKKGSVISISAGSKTGLYTYTSERIKELMADTDKPCGPKFKVLNTGGSQENIDNLLNGTAQIALIQSDILFRNKARIAEQPATRPQISTIASLYPEYTQILVNSDSNIESLIQLAGKQLYIGKEGSGTAINAGVLLESAGLKIDGSKISGETEPGIPDYFSINAKKVSVSDALDGLCDEGEGDATKVDAVFRVTSSIYPKLKKWKNCLKLVNLDSHLLDAILKEHDYYGLTNIKVGGEDYSLLYTRAALVIADDNSGLLSDDLINRLARIVHENLPVAFYGSLPNSKSAILFRGNKIMTRLPVAFHPVAEEYFKSEKIVKKDTWKIWVTGLILWIALFAIKTNTAGVTLHEQRVYATNNSFSARLFYEFTIGQVLWLLRSFKLFLVALWQSIRNLSFFQSPITVTIVGLLIFLWVAMVIIVVSENDHALSHDIPNQFENLPLPNFMIWLLQILTLGESPDGLFPKSLVAKAVTIIVPIMGVVGAFLALMMSTMKNKSLNELRARGLEIPELEDHIVLCGWNDHGLRVVEEISTEIPGAPLKQIAVLDECDAEKPMEHLGLVGENVHFLRGMSSDSENLERVSAKKASGFLVLAGKERMTHRNFRSIFTVRMIASELKDIDRDERPKIMVDMEFSENLDLFCDAGADRVLNTRLIGTVFMAYSVMNMGFSNVITNLMSLASRPVLSRVNAFDHKKVLQKVKGKNFQTAWQILFESGINLLAIVPEKGSTSATMGIFPDLANPVIIGEDNYDISSDDALIIMENQTLQHKKVSAVAYADSHTDIQNGFNHSTPLVVIDRRNESGEELKSLLEKRCSKLYYICADDHLKTDESGRFIAWNGDNESITEVVQKHVLDDQNSKGKSGKIKFLIPTVENPLNFTSHNAIHQDDETIALVLQLNTINNDRFHYTAEIQCKKNLRLFKDVGVQQPIPVHEFASLALTKMALFDGEVIGLILRFMENFFTGELENKSLRKIPVKGTDVANRIIGVNYVDASRELFSKGIQLLAIIPWQEDGDQNRLVALPDKGDDEYNYLIGAEDELFVIS